MKHGEFFLCYKTSIVKTLAKKLYLTYLKSWNKVEYETLKKFDLNTF